MEQINCTGNVERDNDDDKTQMYLILEEVKETVLDFWQGNVDVL